MNRLRAIAFIMTASAVVVGHTMGTDAYSIAGYKWASSPVPFYVNPSNADVSVSAATSAIQTGMNVWNTQSGTAFRFSYAGQVSDTATSLDGRNVVIFRNTSNPDNANAVATTYSWSKNGSRYDSDIIFWDGKYKLFTGSSGCAYTNGQYGVYIEDIATHELGHSLGLMHSSVNDATMYGTYTQCSTNLRTLAADDIAGVKSLYPATASNTAPTVTILTPASATSIVQGTSLTFTGTAIDSQDGTITSRMAWSSSINGSLGTGSGFAKTLSAGSHVITATVTDNGGLSTSRQISVTVTTAPAPAPTTTPTLSAKGYKVKGDQNVDLAWSNLTATSVDIYRDGAKLLTAPNDGKLTDKINQKGGGSYTYKVCAFGTSTCSNQSVVTF
jgi:hypothetical protein